MSVHARTYRKRKQYDTTIVILLFSIYDDGFLYIHRAYYFSCIFIPRPLCYVSIIIIQGDRNDENSIIPPSVYVPVKLYTVTLYPSYTYYYTSHLDRRGTTTVTYLFWIVGPRSRRTYTIQYTHTVVILSLFCK